MAKTYERIEQLEASAERLHESMVENVRRMRRHEQELRELESQIAVLSEGTPGYRRLDILIRFTRLLLKSDHQMIKTGRSILDFNRAVVDHLNGDE